MILHGNCLDQLKKIEDNSLDSLVTDPPYGLSQITESDTKQALQSWLSGQNYEHSKRGFMGKKWDSNVSCFCQSHITEPAKAGSVM